MKRHMFTLCALEICAGQGVPYIAGHEERRAVHSKIDYVANA